MSGDVDDRVRRRFRAGEDARDGDTQRGTDAPAPERAVDQLARLLREEAPLLGDDEVRRRARSLAVDLVGLGPVQALLDDPAVTDVLVNGPGEVWVERHGRLHPSGVVVDRPAVDRAIERLVGPLGLHADRAHPVVDARLADGTRVTAVLPPLAVDGPLVAVRRHRRDPVPLDRMASPAVADQLRRRLVGRRNLVVFGATGSGKTTLLGSLCAELPADERVVTVEDVAELRLDGRGIVRLEARPGGADGVGRVGFRELVRVALRLRPDRIVVGEVRGAEAADMVWALSTGHDGSMSTLHAATAHDALRRVTSFAVAGADGAPVGVVQDQVHAAVHSLVGTARLPDGGRRVVSVHDVVPADGRLVPVAEDGP
ncbi:CpaF family protein [Dermatobacter hominis]|uniref:CpaF family protein n=1 Tax=Dermatobacter hominis TaxID=2884263 RepID=UPI001D114E21|nr:ATPase, T2SS/T4P/T4SS family [Dermatobacter hominis]UDY34416.1 Flp pilus assembly complex ATPase component TadA [Dermatobacter hominis]